MNSSNENKRRYMSGCFSGNWVDVEVLELKSSEESTFYNYKRKDLQTLLDELEEIKRNIERIAEKERVLEDLMRINREKQGYT